MKVLLRLLPYIRAHVWAFSFGITGLLVARIFEAMIPMYVKMGIDSLTQGDASIDFTSTVTQQALFYPAMAIIFCVIAQMLVTIVSRILVRRIGMYAAFDLRNRIYHHLQLQGPSFFQQYSIGDLMARTINDISLVRQVIAGSSGSYFAKQSDQKLKRLR